MSLLSAAAQLQATKAFLWSPWLISFEKFLYCEETQASKLSKKDGDISILWRR